MIKLQVVYLALLLALAIGSYFLAKTLGYEDWALVVAILVLVVPISLLGGTSGGARILASVLGVISALFGKGGKSS